MMKLKPFLLTVLVAIAVLVTFLVGLPASAGAASNQGMNQPAILSAPDPNFKITVYMKPGMKEQKVGYGLAGDRVTVLEQVGSNEGYFWNYVRFDNTPNAEGWIRTDYLSFQLSANQTQGMPTRRQTYQTSSQSQNYLGDRQSTDQGTSSYRQSAYSQQANSSNSLLNLPQTMLNLFKKS